MLFLFYHRKVYLFALIKFNFYDLKNFGLINLIILFIINIGHSSIKNLETLSKTKENIINKMILF